MKADFESDHAITVSAAVKTTDAVMNQTVGGRVGFENHQQIDTDQAALAVNKS